MIALLLLLCCARVLLADGWVVELCLFPFVIILHVLPFVVLFSSTTSSLLGVLIGRGFFVFCGCCGNKKTVRKPCWKSNPRVALLAGGLGVTTSLSPLSKPRAPTC
ncbi:unnamed protein product [Ectocarpus fasciculatus]